ncbi:MAG: hypothetical protein FWB71_04000 [Defluviitaleaceae bacterium]|nr:hypothetical protein [Defluviitaleaceae bacterium]
MKIDKKHAAELFAQWKEICEADNGGLWGIDLHTPFMFIDEQRNVVANCADGEGRFVADGDVFVGKFPEDMAFAATSVDVYGKSWGTMPWFMVETGHKDAVDTMIHEGFHCIQPKLFGKNKLQINNGHLNKPAARLLVLLEMRALLFAFENEGEARKNAIAAALRFRENRMAADNKILDEAVNEIGEGTAVFTECKLTHTREELIAKFTKDINTAANLDSMAHFSGYLLGALLCFMIDELDPAAKRAFRADTIMADILQKAAGITEIPAFEAIDTQLYGHDEIAEQIAAKEKKNAEMMAGFLEKFTKKPTLTILGEGGGGIRGQIIPVDGLGTVLKGRYEYHGEIGRMIIEHGEALSVEKNVYKVSAENMRQEGDRLIGIDWEIDLAVGHKLVQDGENFTISM